MQEISRCQQYIKHKRLGGDLEVTRAFGDYIFDENDDEGCENRTKDRSKDRNNQAEKPSLERDNNKGEREREKERERDKERRGTCYKLEGLICDPYITRTKLNRQEDEFVVVACDGVWEVTGVENTMMNTRRNLREEADCQLASEKLISQANDLHTTDNVSAIIIGFAEQVVNNDLSLVSHNPNSNGSIIQNPYKFQIVRPRPRTFGSKLGSRFKNSRLRFSSSRLSRSSRSSRLSRASSAQEQEMRNDLSLPKSAIITPSLSNPPLQIERVRHEQTGEHRHRHTDRDRDRDEHRKDDKDKKTQSTQRTHRGGEACKPINAE